MKHTEQDPLRNAAEAKLGAMPGKKAMPRADDKLLHELQVHQIELEMQNEQLRQSQVELEKSRDRYVDFYDFSPVGYITLNQAGMIDEINLTGASLLGVERKKLPFHRLASYVAPEDRDKWHLHFLSVIRDGNRLPCELRLQHAGKPQFFAHLDCLRLKNDSGEPVVRIVLTDISEHKLIEESVRAQEEFFRTIVENFDDFLEVLDLQGRRLYSSPSYAKFLGSAETLKGNDFFAVIDQDDSARVKQAFHETIRSGRSYRLNYRLVLADGSIHFMESCIGLIRNSQGQPFRIVIVSRDITERLKEYEEIRNLAFYDSLTQLPNRRLLSDRLEQAMIASKRSGRYCALLFLDLDNFKSLNDSHGHDIGDILLAEVASRINSCVREMDTVSRFGGDEFVVMLCELDENKAESTRQARIVAEKIRVALFQPYELKIQAPKEEGTIIEYFSAASIGVVMFINHETTADNILKLADREMYKAKAAGRNQIRFCDCAP